MMVRVKPSAVMLLIVPYFFVSEPVLEFGRAAQWEGEDAVDD
jgi:hypothetical protein